MNCWESKPPHPLFEPHPIGGLFELLFEMIGKICNGACKWCWNDSGNRFPPVRILCLVVNCLFYLADFFIDLFAAIEHYLAWRDGNQQAFSYFVATLTFIILPTIIVNLVSFALYSWCYYVHNNRKKRNACRENFHAVESENIRVMLCRPLRKIRLKKSVKSAKGDIDAIQLVPVVSVTREIEEKPKLSKQLSFSKQKPIYSRKQITASDLETLAEEDADRDEQTDIQEKEEIDAVPEFYPLDQLKTKEFIFIALLHILQVGFLYRVIRLLTQRSKDSYSFDRYRDISFLRLMEAFLESAPQLFLQLYIIVLEVIPNPVRKAVTAFAVVISIVSLSLAVADYTSACKDVVYYDPPPNKVRKPRLSWSAYFLIILWHLGMIISRGLAISLFASEYGYYVFVFGVVHYLLMVYWLYRQDAFVMKSELTDYSVPTKRQNLCNNYGIEFLCAAFNMFFIFKLISGDSVLYSTAYYVLVFVENILMICLWYVHIDYSLELWYQEAAPITVFMSFMIGLCFMLLYYLYFQPRDMPDLQRDPNMDHPTMTMTCTLNRLYRKTK